jgi:DNA-binding transcriptional regulator YiaG
MALSNAEKQRRWRDRRNALAQQATEQAAAPAPVAPAQIKAARALIGWTQRDLATKAKVSMASLANYERGASTLMAQNRAAIQTALEAGGIVFLNGTSLGVRIRRGCRASRCRRRASIAVAAGS